MPSKFVLTTVKKGKRKFLSFADATGVYMTDNLHNAHKFDRYADANIYKNDNFMPGKSRGWVAVRESDEMVCGKFWFLVEKTTTCEFVALVGSKWGKEIVFTGDYNEATFFVDNDEAWSYCRGNNVVVTLSEAISHFKATHNV